MAQHWLCSNQRHILGCTFQQQAAEKGNIPHITHANKISHTLWLLMKFGVTAWAVVVRVTCGNCVWMCMYDSQAGGLATGGSGRHLSAVQRKVIASGYGNDRDSAALVQRANTLAIKNHVTRKGGYDFTVAYLI